MKTELKKYTVKEMVDGFVYNELEGKGGGASIFFRIH